MSWNYRVYRSKTRRPGGSTQTAYSIREVYYDKKDGPEFYTADDMSPNGRTLKELQEDLVMMLQATYQPIFKASEIKRRRL